MCGIAGLINLDREPVDLEVLREMARAMAHRGPDGEGFYIDGNIGLAHRRLAIIDPLDGAQPFIDDAMGLALVYNGEIYNFIEIRKDLEDKHTFRTHSDTEVLLKAYATWGISCLDRFRGMFAFALYDRKERAIYLVRDRLGIKPLYYCRSSDNRFLFASELSTISRVAYPLDIDPSSVSEYFRWQYVPTPKSIYKNVSKLEPGHYLRLDLTSGRMDKECYWTFQPSVLEKSEHEFLDLLNEELEEIFRIYTRSDVPFGAFLSGGVDSSLVTALMSRQLSAPVKTFSIGFREKTYSELDYAGEVAKMLECDHHEQVVTPRNALELLRDVACHFGEPFADSSAIPTFLVSQMTTDRVKMVLSGDGGDELFGGYWSYVETFRDMTRTVPSFLKETFAPLTTFLARRKRPGRFVHAVLPPLPKHLLQREIFHPSELRSLLQQSFDTDWPFRMVLDRTSNGIDDVTRFQYLDARTYLLDDILTKVDRMSMANSLEVRVPLLDHKLVELAFQLPLSSKLSQQGGKIRTKHLLTRSAERFFSPTFLDRPKMGFGIPIVVWCQGDLKEQILESLNDRKSPVYQWLDYRTVQGLLQDFFSGQTGRVAQVWALLMFGLWLEKAPLAS